MPLDPQLFKNAMSQFASGVTVVTTEHEGQKFGMTVAAFSSVSLDPPLVLVCLANSASAREPLVAAKRFAVHILAADQATLGARFAGMLKSIRDRFDGVAVGTAVTGSPILGDCLAWLDCRLVHAYPGGDHTICVGEVVAASVDPSRDALLHYRRNWRTLSTDMPQHEGE
jgi:flavin reductase (DIM6/NTAB) family NADH-FMN oxidoreductase RutF